MNNSKDQRKAGSSSLADNNDNKAMRQRKTWSKPQLIVESVESTKGGNFGINTPGDDGWYTSQG